MQRNLLNYISTKPARDGLKAQKSEKARKAYREQHQSNFIMADAAARYFREHGITKLPASKALQREIEPLTVQRNARYNDYREKRERVRELQTVKGNLDQILRREPSQQKKQEQEHKDRPEMIPKPHKKRGCGLSPAILPDFQTGLTGRKKPENDTENIQKMPPIPLPR